MTEDWRVVPFDIRYEISNRGRMRRIETGKLLTPSIKRGPFAFYTIKRHDGKSQFFNIKNAMFETWGVDFNPNREWCANVRKEALEARPARKRQYERKPQTSHKQTGRRCKDCGQPLGARYWYRCERCWSTYSRAGAL